MEAIRHLQTQEPTAAEVAAAINKWQISLLENYFHMKATVPGHAYLLDNFEEGDSPQLLNFIHKEPDVDDPEKLVTVHNGTSNEEVLEMLIDRMKFLNTKFPCRENALCITDLESARNWLLQRTRGRLVRGVEGKHIK